MHPDLKLWYLRNLELFSSVVNADFKLLLSVSDFKTLKQHDIIYAASTQVDKIYVVIKGRVKVAYCIDKSVEVVSEILKEGDVFGELSLQRSANTQGEFSQVLNDEAIVCAFSLSDFEKVLRMNPNITMNFSRMLADKLKIISGKYSDLVFKDVRSRVLNFFILHAQYEGKWNGHKAEIQMYCTHQEIANFTASKRQTVTKVINCLVREKKIFYQGRSKVIIPDVRKLEV